MTQILVPLWILWLILLLVLTFIWARQSKALLSKLKEEDAEFCFSGWFKFIKSCWRMNFSYAQDSELYEALADYRKLLNLWLVVAGLVLVTRLLIVIVGS